LTLASSKVNILTMNSLEISLNKIAENILHIDEASLTSLWEKAVIIFSIINAVRAKNAIFNEKLLNTKAQKKKMTPERPQGKSYLKLVK
jgi:uncharacterized protein YjgD (DUF1641 family)